MKEFLIFLMVVTIVLFLTIMAIKGLKKSADVIEENTNVVKQIKVCKDADLDYIIVTDGLGITRAICRKKE